MVVKGEECKFRHRINTVSIGQSNKESQLFHLAVIGY